MLLEIVDHKMISKIDRFMWKTTFSPFLCLFFSIYFWIHINRKRAIIILWESAPEQQYLITNIWKLLNTKVMIVKSKIILIVLLIFDYDRLLWDLRHDWYDNKCRILNILRRFANAWKSKCELSRIYKKSIWDFRYLDLFRKSK